MINNMEYKYKTKGDVELVVPGVGVSVNGIITSSTPLESPNLELITNEPTAEAPAPAHVAGVVPQNTQPTYQVQPPAPVQAVAPETPVNQPTPTAPAVESNGQI
jgi:hypothetical protein